MGFTGSVVFRNSSPLAIATSFVVFLLVGCSTASRVTTRDTIHKSTEAQSRPHTVNADGGVKIVAPEKPSPSSGPSHPGQKLKLGLLLGPGGSRTLAYAGVFSALEREKVGVSGIVGLEWGALLGALYAEKGQAHQVDWRLYKMEQMEALKANLMAKILQGERQIASFESFLLETFNNLNQKATHIPFICPSVNAQKNELQWLRHGQMRQTVAKCLPFPPVFALDRQFSAAPLSLEEGVAQLAEMGMDIVLWVDVLSAREVPGQLPPMVHWVWSEGARTKVSGLTHRSPMEVVRLVIRTPKASLDDFEDRKILSEIGFTQSLPAIQKLATEHRF